MDHSISVKQQIKVQGSRAVSDSMAPIPAQAALNLQHFRQQLFRFERSVRNAAAALRTLAGQA